MKQPSTVLELIRSECYEVSPHKPIKLASGRLSHEYVKLKRMTLQPRLLYPLCHDLFNKMTDSHKPNDPVCPRQLKDWAACPVVGAPQGGYPLAFVTQSIIHQRCQVSFPSVLVRDKPKDHGPGTTQAALGCLDGLPVGSLQVLIMEDVVTSGGTSLKLANLLRDAGVRKITVLSVVNRQEGADELFAKEEIGFQWLHTLAEIREVLA